MGELCSRICKLIDVKSIVTIIMTIGMMMMLFGGFTISQEASTLFSTSYGAIITYFFTKKQE